MQRARVVTTVALLLLVSGSASANAQGRGRGRGKDPDPPGRVSDDEQRRRVAEEQQRTAQYKKQLDEQVRAAQHQAAQLQQQKRTAQYRAQQEYARQLAEQQQRAQAARDYRNDPYISTPHTYRYSFSGTAHQTNQYGADLLKQAVNLGYRQGVRAGQADHEDRWAANYQKSAVYRDANFGYNGNYVSEVDYNYYFREGFRRGYDDGYNRRSQYGTTSNGTVSILGSLLSSILGFQSLH